MSVLGSGLHAAELYEDALSVKEAELSMLRRIGAPEEHILVTQSNLAITYRSLGRREEALCVKRDVYSERLKLNGEKHETTLRDARATLRARETPPPLPWEAHRDDAGRPYYHNRETGESVWTLPDELLARETPSP